MRARSALRAASSHLIQRRIPFARDICKLFINFAQFLFETILRFDEPRAQSLNVATFERGFAKFVERFVQLENLFEELGRRLLLCGSLFSQP